jgi:hypothetical protein
MTPRTWHAALWGAILSLGCYEADTSTLPLQGQVARVLLTDAPFPYDSVDRVDVYVTRIDASATYDTSGAATWTLIVAPRRRFNLLSLQQGTTALLGEGELAAGQYAAVRMVINTDSSAIRWTNGSAAQVNWQNAASGGELVLHALVEAPVQVSAGASGAEIVIDFDVGRSFLFDFFGTREFTFLPWIRAVTTSITGAIEGTVTSSHTGLVAPVRNANVSVYRGDSSLAATGRTNAAGFYRVAFLRTGTYRVRVEQPDLPFLAPVVAAGIAVTAGHTTLHSVALPPAGGGGAYVQITGPSSVGVGGTIALRAAVGDAAGNPVVNPVISWTISDTGLVTLRDSGTTAFVGGKRPGTVSITALSGGKADTVTVTVIGSTAPVASITVSPASRSLSVSDSVQSFGSFTAVLRDSAGNQLANRAITWTSSDTAVVAVLFGYEAQVYVRALRVGTGLVYALSEGKTGQATVTVAP